MARILIVEDDERLVFIVEKILEGQNHIVDSVYTGDEGLNFILEKPYDLIVLDWELPGSNGLEICHQYRDSGGSSPILFLTGKDQVSNKVNALDTGADDYICKPFSKAEFLARVKALLRRPVIEKNSVVNLGTIELDLNSKNATVNGIELSLTRSEFNLLHYFVKNPGRVFTYDEIVDRISKTDKTIASKSVRQLVSRLRTKIEKGKAGSHIITVSGQGYKFVPDS